MKQMTSAIAAIVLSASAIAVHADDVKDVAGEFLYEGNGTESRIECERLALEGARIDAINKAFGKSVSQVILQRETMTERGESSYVDYQSETELRGTWIGDSSAPVYTYSLDDSGNYRVKCKIRGKARKASNEATEFEAYALRNTPEWKYADTHFKSGDRMFAGFRSPVDGYLSIYLLDDQQQAYRLLPYRSSPDATVKIKGKKEYTFFDENSLDTSLGDIDPMELQAAGDFERNTLVFIFSPNAFNKAMDSSVSDNLPDQLSFKDYTRWITKAQTIDPKLTVKKIVIDIEK